MNKHRLIHIEPAETIPVTCPHCAAALGTIDGESPLKRASWERFTIPVWIEQPAEAGLSADAGLSRGTCPACNTPLATLHIRLGRAAAAGSADEAPRLSLVMHGAADTSWAMIEHHMKGFHIIEHVFGPILDGEHVEEAFDPVLELASALPRPEAA